LIPLPSSVAHLDVTWCRVCYPELAKRRNVFGTAERNFMLQFMFYGMGSYSVLITKQLIAQTLPFSNRAKAAANNNDTGYTVRI
jgi:hypothetical protein